MKFKNSKKQGDHGLGQAIAYFCSEGMPVSVPLTDSQDYDLVVEFEDDLKKVQVKTSNRKHKGEKNYSVELRTKGGNKSREKAKLATEMAYDFLFVTNGDRKHYLIPKSKMTTATTITLGKKYEEFLVG